MHTGGRGKSTMAKVLFNRLAGSFSHSAFVEIHVGDGADKTAQHLAAALKTLGATGKAAEGAAMLSQKLKGFVRDKKALFVLDNVWTASQLAALLPTEWGVGSVVIVTSRFERFTDSRTWRQVRDAADINNQPLKSTDKQPVKQCALDVAMSAPRGRQYAVDVCLEV
jgi:hypothetical protein